MSRRLRDRTFLTKLRGAGSPDALYALFTADAAVLWAKKPDIVLEALSEGEAGHAVIRAALEAGCDVASANKQAVSRDPDAALALAGRRVHDWSGGTRLGECLRAFNDEWGVRGMARGAIDCRNYLNHLTHHSKYLPAVPATEIPPQLRPTAHDLPRRAQ